ncbi:hypothetical protein C8R44DRAFT_714955 [Mycena epipterygia]|nr:hypothetical protein C8R44DRAFT_714955 [Mycena epipterygia]
MFFNTFLVFAAISSSAFLDAHAHGALTGITGANGVQAAGFGIIASTPRTGSTRKPFEQDTSIIRDKDIAAGGSVCGRTLAGGDNNVAAQLAAASSAGLPTAAADGSVTMTLHQVNGDGAGPYTCDVSGDGGNTWQAATVTTQVAGKNGRSNAKAVDLPLVAQMPAAMACTAGPNGDACIMRCRNPANAGPFGGCAAIASGAASATNATTTAATDATAAAATNATTAAATNATTVATTPAAESAPAAAGEAAAPAVEAPAAAGEAAAPAVKVAARAVAAAAPAVEAAAATPAAEAATPAQGGLADLLSGLPGGLGDALSGLTDALGRKRVASEGPAKRYIASRIAGKRSGYWLDNQ